MPTKKVVESELVKRLKLDRELEKDPTTRMTFLSYGYLFDEDLANNLEKTSLELDSKYQTGDPSSWLRFVKYPIVKKYIDTFLDELAEKKAQIVLSQDAGKTRDALNVAKSIQEKNKGDDNANIIVFFMPQKRYVQEGN
jgi:hypothetical protein